MKKAKEETKNKKNLFPDGAMVIGDICVINMLPKECFKLGVNPNNKYYLEMK